MSKKIAPLLLALAGVSVIAAAPTATAQIIGPVELYAPPEVASYDANSVDVVEGTITTRSPSVVIGTPGAGGLAYQMVLAQNSWSHSVDGRIIDLGGGSVFAYVGGYGERFNTFAGAYYPATQNGTSLTYNATSQIYTFTMRDGTKAEFARDLVGDYERSNTSLEAAIEKITYPNGDITEYGWGTDFFNDCGNGTPPPCGPYALPGTYVELHRIESVRTNRGYQLFINYATDDAGSAGVNSLDWQTPTKVIGLNNGYEVCDVGGACTGLTNTWPTIDISGGLWEASNDLTFTDANGAATIYRADAQGQVSAIRTPEATTDNITYTYDGSGRVNTITRGPLTTSYSYFDFGGVRTITITEPGAAVYKIEADISGSVYYGNIIATVDQMGKRTEFEYDTLRRVIEIAPPEGTLGVGTSTIGDGVTAYTYDSRGNVTEIRRTPTSGTRPDIVTSATYSSSCTNQFTCNQPTTTTDAAGNVTSYTYNSATGQTIRIDAPTVGSVTPTVRFLYSAQTAYYLADEAASSVSAAPTSVTVLRQIRRCRTSNATACEGTDDEFRTLFKHGSTGVPNNLHVSEVDNRIADNSVANITKLSYTIAGDVEYADPELYGTGNQTRYIFDAMRRPIGMIGPDPDQSGPRNHGAMRVTYDDEGRVVERESGTTTGYTNTNWASFSALQSQEIDFDVIGRPTAARAYDSASVQQALIEYTYGTDGRIECVAQRMNPSAFSSTPSSACSLGIAGSFGDDRITRYTHRADGRVRLVFQGVGTAEEAQTQRIWFTDNGRAYQLEDGEGNLTRWEFDEFYRNDETRYSNKTTGAPTTLDRELFTYDNYGRLATRTTRSGGTFSYSYDVLSRVTTVTAPSGTAGTSFTYDNFSNVLTVTDTSSGGGTITNTFDAMGRLESQAGAHGTVSYEYDDLGRRTRMDYPDTFYLTYDYSEANQLTHIRENGATSGIGVLATFTYDDQGRRTKLERGNGTQTTYDYDALGRLDELVQDLNGTVDDNTDTFSFNPAGQITQRSRSNTDYSYAGTINVDTLFGHNRLNQTTTMTEGSNVYTSSYDNRANMTIDGWTGFTYSYDEYNRLTGVTGGLATVTLEYDPIGRVEEYSGWTGDFEFAYDGSNLIAVFEGKSTVSFRYVHGPGMDEPLVRYNRAGDRFWLHADVRGSIIAYTDESGDLYATNTYDEYGNPGPGNFDLFQYTGQIKFWDIQPYYYKNRWYHPRHARFMSADPIGVAGGMNLYAYVGGDPVNFTDPWGLARQCIIHGDHLTDENGRPQPTHIRPCPHRDNGVTRGVWQPEFQLPAFFEDALDRAGDLIDAAVDWACSLEGALFAEGQLAGALLYTAGRISAGIAFDPQTGELGAYYSGGGSLDPIYDNGNVGGQIGAGAGGGWAESMEFLTAPASTLDVDIAIVSVTVASNDPIIDGYGGDTAVRQASLSFGPGAGVSQMRTQGAMSPRVTIPGFAGLRGQACGSG